MSLIDSTTLFETATSLSRQQLHQEALDMYDQVLLTRPDHAGAHFNRALALKALMRLDEAVDGYNRGLAVRPDTPRAYEPLAELLKQTGRPNEALDALRRGLSYAPGGKRLTYMLVNELLELELFDELVEVCRTGLVHLPDDLYLMRRLGQVLSHLRRRDQALNVLEKIVQLCPDEAAGHNNLGVELQLMGMPEQAIERFDRATEIDPTLNMSHVNRAVCQLELGRFETGWKGYERRVDPNTFHARVGYSRLIWTGDQSLKGKRILVHSEFGLGDTIQFCRYIPLLEGAGAKVLFAPQPALRSVMRSLSAAMDIVEPEDPALTFDFHCRTMSLPGAFGTRIETIPANTPYLAASSERVDVWRARLKSSGLNVGICWRGSKAGDRRGLSFRLDDLAPLACIPGVRLISLQKSSDPDQIAQAAAHADVETPLDPADVSEQAFSETAALAEACDLVISCDTSVAHLAGALGRPTWVVMPVEGDWRWLKGRSDTPWYPTMKLFRPSLLGGGNGVFKAVETELEKLAATRA